MAADWLRDSLVPALGWTVIHSLWQGALLALTFALLSAFLSRNSPQARYLLGILILAFMVVVSAVTFMAQLDQAPVLAAPAPAAANAISMRAGAPQSPPAGLVSSLKSYCQRNVSLIAALWLAGVLALTLRLLGGCLVTRRIKRRHAHPAPPVWRSRLLWLGQRFNLKGPVALMESRLVSGPLTLGHFKPIIFFPVGLLAGMPPDQVEALLAHELAHIRRRDYLVNILQSLIDILYFYHPALRWVSSRVRREREHCCDDMAAAVTGDARRLARALTSVQEWRAALPALSLQAAGKRNDLLERIRRLLKMEKTRSFFTEKIVGACLVILFLVIAGLGAQGTTDKKRQPATPQPAPAPASAIPVVAAEPAALPNPEPAPLPNPKPAVVPASQEDEIARLQAEIAALRKELQEMKAREAARIRLEKELAASGTTRSLAQAKLKEELDRRMAEENRMAHQAQEKQAQAMEMQLLQEQRERQKIEEQARLQYEQERKFTEQERMAMEKARQEEMMRLKDLEKEKAHAELAKAVAEKEFMQARAAEEARHMEEALQLSLTGEKGLLNRDEQLRRIEEQLAAISAALARIKAENKPAKPPKPARKE